MTRMLSFATLLAVIGAAGAVAAAGSAAAGGLLCVDPKKPGCFATIQAAVNAAQDGDTIEIGPGTFAGGITITKSVQLVGTSAAATVISGGGPVITIGSFEGDNDITVAIDRVTVSGGLNDAQPSPEVVFGGGVWIPQSVGQTTGATVTISRSVVTGNRVTAGDVIPPGGFSCVGSPHPCAFIGGAGIDNAGVLTLDHTDVTNNTAGSTPTSPSLASNAFGGGITSHRQGTLTLRHCSVTGNAAAVSPPNGAFTDGGGIDDLGGPLTIDDSSVDRNSSVVTAATPSSFPFDTQQEANAGGIQLEPGSTATIRHSSVDGNTVESFNGGGDASADAAGLHNHGTLLLDHSSVSGNSASATVPPGADFVANVNGGAVELGPGPSTTTIAHSRVDGNASRADSPNGAVFIGGAAVANLDGTTTLDHAEVSGNGGAANGANALVIPTGTKLSGLGGGIDNISFGGSGPVLTLDHSTVSRNTLTTTTDTPPRGGGVFTRDVFTDDPFAVTLDHSTIAGNTPDDCDGC